MMDATSEPQFQHMVIGLLRHYSFETNRPLSLVVATWIKVYPSQWLVKAIVEALYQGRYKLVSVEQILLIWQRRGQPIAHFNHEFERIVCDRILDAEDIVQAASDHDAVEQGNPNANVAQDSVGNDQLAQWGHHRVASETNDPDVEVVNKAIAPASAHTFNLGQEQGSTVSSIQPFSVALMASPASTPPLNAASHQQPENKTHSHVHNHNDKLLVDLETANLEAANSETANLETANLETANLETANLETANLETANLEAANSEPIGLAAIEAGTKRSRAPKPIHQFRPTCAAVNVPAKLQAIAHNTTTRSST